MNFDIDRYTRHRCALAHATAKELLVCAIRSLTRDEVSGEGDYALIHEFRTYHKASYGERFTAFYRVDLFQTEAELLDAKNAQERAHTNRTGRCSDRCWGRPRAVKVVL